MYAHVSGRWHRCQQRGTSVGSASLRVSHQRTLPSLLAVIASVLVLPCSQATSYTGSLGAGSPIYCSDCCAASQGMHVQTYKVSSAAWYHIRLLIGHAGGCARWALHQWPPLRAAYRRLQIARCSTRLLVRWHPVRAHTLQGG